MKKYILLLFHYIFFIASLLFLPTEIALYSAVFLISCLALQNIIYCVLPLVLCFYIPLEYSYLLLSIVAIHLLLYPLIKRNRFYALSIYSCSLVTVFLLLFFKDGFTANSIKISILLFVVYSCINALYIFQKIDQKQLLIPYNQKLIDLVMLLGYFFIFFLFGDEPLLILFLFMQLYLIKDLKYNILFALIYTIMQISTNISLLTNVLPAIAVSFVPPAVLLTLSYQNLIWIVFAIYTLALTFFQIQNKRITIEHDYINSLFQDFTKYTNELALEYHKNTTLKKLKEERIEQISNTFCQNCTKHTLCKIKLDRRYSFLAAAIQGMKQNIYDCPHYQKFYLNTNVEVKNTSLEYSAVRALADELSFLYNQSLALKGEYEKFINLLADNGYEVLDIDIFLASPTLYFTFYFSNQKPIVETLLIKLAYKAFGEYLEVKILPEKQLTTVHFYKAPELKITYAHTILAKNNNLMSGDNYYIKKNPNSSYIFALSDGMGSGYHAYLESADALKTIAGLSSYHFSMKTILRLLEDVYELKSNYDRYATLDLLYINTANRKINLYKMGSTTTYILHNHQLYAYENNALPLKLDEVNSAYEMDIYSGDYIFLLSDGITDFISKDEFYSIVKGGTQSAQIMCEEVIQYIKKKEKNELKDDLSLIAIKAI